MSYPSTRLVEDPLALQLSPTVASIFPCQNPMSLSSGLLGLLLEKPSHETPKRLEVEEYFVLRHIGWAIQSSETSPTSYPTHMCRGCGAIQAEIPAKKHKRR